MFLDYLDSPLGMMEIRATLAGITHINFVATAEQPTPHAHTDQAKQQLEEYFTGQRQTFTVPLAAQGTDFQRAVWQTLVTIPYGKAVSYLDIALALDKPKAVRAVGAANGKNPIGIIVPCHRVIGSNRSLTGYAGGLERKEWLLRHEGIMFKPESQQIDPSQLSLGW